MTAVGIGYELTRGVLSTSEVGTTVIFLREVR